MKLKCVKLQKNGVDINIDIMVIIPKWKKIISQSFRLFNNLFFIQKCIFFNKSFEISYNDKQNSSNASPVTNSVYIPRIHICIS